MADVGTPPAPEDPAQYAEPPATALLDALFADAGVGLAFWDRDLRYRRVNETLARMNGLGVAEHVGASLHDVLGDPAGLLADALRSVMETRQPLELEVSAALPRDPAMVRALEATYFPVIGGDDELLGVGGVVRDVTDRHELELEQSRLLREALVERARAEVAEVRSNDAREEAELARERIALLARAGRRMAESMDWEQTLRAVVRSAVPAVADWCSLTMVVPGGRVRVVAVAHRDPAREELAWELARRHPPGRDALAGPLRILSADAIRAAAQDADHLRLLERLEVSQLAVAPLETPDGVIGALAFVLGESGRGFSGEDEELISSLAARAALHIQNARLYTERSHIARTLEASLRPRALPSIPGAELAARFLPAGAHNEVGGDFYDVFPSGDGVWTAIVGDVSGKGPEAAAITALARHTLRTASMLHDDPAANLALLDRALQEDAATGNFCTVFYTRICQGASGLDFRFANGGHPAPLLLRADGRVEPVEGGRGPLVGGLAGARFDRATLHLAPGELLLMYTDGVIEVRTSDAELGERELRATLAAHAGDSAEEVVAAVERRAVQLHRGEPRDDIALVAIRACGEGPGGAGS